MGHIKKNQNNFNKLLQSESFQTISSIPSYQSPQIFNWWWRLKSSHHMHKLEISLFFMIPHYLWMLFKNFSFLLFVTTNIFQLQTCTPNIENFTTTLNLSVWQMSFTLKFFTYCSSFLQYDDRKLRCYRRRNGILKLALVNFLIE
jgi:hypothetical protein